MQSHSAPDISVSIVRSESPLLECPQTFTSSKFADAQLALAAASAPSDGTYHKTHVELDLEGMHRLSFRIDLVHPSCAPFEGVLNEAMSFLAYAHEVGDEEMRRKVFILRGFIVSMQMFGTREEPTPLYLELTQGAEVAHA